MHERKKLEEAEYFYSEMHAHVGEPDPFRYNLSAFLSAARSVLQYAHREAGSKPGGQNWYETCVTGTPVFRFFRNKRDISVHVQPVEPSRSVSVTTPDIVMIGDSGLVVMRDQRGNIIGSVSSERTTPSPRPDPRPASLRYRYLFPDWQGPEDVLELAQLYLSELKSFVGDGIATGFLRA